MARPEKIRLGEILMKQNLLSEEQLTLALQQQKVSGRKLGRVIVECGFATEQAISRALARQLSVVILSLKSFDFRLEVVQTLPEAQARRLRAIVVARL